MDEAVVGGDNRYKVVVADRHGGIVVVGVDLGTVASFVDSVAFEIEWHKRPEPSE